MTTPSSYPDSTVNTATASTAYTDYTTADYTLPDIATTAAVASVSSVICKYIEVPILHVASIYSFTLQYV
jgi:hypothetical protein